MTTAAAALAPVDRAVTVRLSVNQAWELFTQRLPSWWPLASHSCSRDARAKVTFEPRAGGAVTEQTPDGKSHPWGTLIEWDPPRRFAMTWHPGQPREQATRLCVTFTGVAEGTEVRVHHGGWEARGDDAPALRERYDEGWPVVLAELEYAAARGPHD